MGVENYGRRQEEPLHFFHIRNEASLMSKKLHSISQQQVTMACLVVQGIVPRVCQIVFNIDELNRILTTNVVPYVKAWMESTSKVK